MSAPDDDTLRRLLAGLRHGPVYITGGRCDGDSRAVEAFCDIIRVAPALAAEVLRLRERAEKAEAERDAVREDFHAMEEAFYAMQARAEKAEAAARAYRDATDVPDGEYDATRHAEALAALNRVLGGGQ